MGVKNKCEKPGLSHAKNTGLKCDLFDWWTVKGINCWDRISHHRRISWPL